MNDLVQFDGSPDLGFDLFQFLGSRTRPVREVESQAIFGNQGSFLLDVFAENASQRVIQEMRRGVI